MVYTYPISLRKLGVIMLDIKLIIENPDLIKARLLKKGYEVDFTEIIEKSVVQHFYYTTNFYFLMDSL